LVNRDLERHVVTSLLRRVTRGAASYADFQIVSLGGGDPEVVAQRLRAQPDVEYAQPRYRVRPMFAPNDPLYSLQWNYPQIGMDRAWDINRGASSDVIVAILDTGVAFRSAVLRYTAIAWQRDDGVTFPALGPVDVPFAPAPDLGADRFVAPRDFIWDDQLPFDLAGHGTHVAGTVGQLTNGVGGAGWFFNVRLMPVKVIDTAWDFIFDSLLSAPTHGSRHPLRHRQRRG
jgi:serine protease